MHVILQKYERHLLTLSMPFIRLVLMLQESKTPHWKI